MEKIFLLLMSGLMFGCAVACDEKSASEHIALGQYSDAYKKIKACDEAALSGKSLAIKASLISYWQQGNFREEERLFESVRLFRLAAAKGNAEAVNALISVYRSDDQRVHNEVVADCLKRSYLKVGKNPDLNRVLDCLE